MQVQRFIMFLILMIAYRWDLKVYQTILGNLASLTTAIPEVVYDSVANHYVQESCALYRIRPLVFSTYNIITKQFVRELKSTS